jgi:hypothetical protein
MPKSKGGNEPQANTLLRIAGSASLFCTPDGTAHGDIEVAGHRETWPINSTGFRRRLTTGFYQETNGVPSSEAMKGALSMLDAKAHASEVERTVYTRVASLDGKLYLDLADMARRAVEIDSAGWRVIDRPPVRFRRTAGMRPLPAPEPGGSVDALREFVKVPTMADFMLITAWLLATLRDRGPYPVLVRSASRGQRRPRKLVSYGRL